MSHQPRPLKYPPIFPLGKGLVAWYPFDDRSGAVLRDRSGKCNHGTISGASWVTRRRGSALSFDGVNDYVKVLNSTNLNLTNLLTIEALIYTETLPTAAPRILSKEKTTDLESFALLYLQSTGNVGLAIAGSFRVSTPSPPSLNVWLHVVVTYDKVEGKARIYIDGALSNTGNYATSIPVTTYDIYIGNNPTNERDFDGIIKEIRVYNRVLNAAEIKRLYESEILLVRQ